MLLGRIGGCQTSEQPERQNPIQSARSTLGVCSVQCLSEIESTDCFCLIFGVVHTGRFLLICHLSYSKEVDRGSVDWDFFCSSFAKFEIARFSRGLRDKNCCQIVPLAAIDPLVSTMPKSQRTKWVYTATKATGLEYEASHEVPKNFRSQMINLLGIRGARMPHDGCI